MWTRKGEYYRFLNNFGTVAGVQRTAGAGLGRFCGADRRKAGPFIIANRDHIANGSG